jgi:hypothetical protein
VLEPGVPKADYLRLVALWAMKRGVDLPEISICRAPTDSPGRVRMRGHRSGRIDAFEGCEPGLTILGGDQGAPADFPCF